MRVSILIFDGFTSLDAIGGYEVLARIPGVDLEFFAEERGIVAADTRRLGLVAFRSFAEVTATDVLYVPGGPGAVPLEKDPRYLTKIRELDATSKFTVGICNGVGLLAAAGLLTGKRAATNFFYQDRLRAHGAIYVPDRYHREGKYVTGGGVSASIDTALYLASVIGGDTLAKALQLGVEHFPAPPFPERSPAESPPEVLAIVRAFEESGASEMMMRLEPPWKGSIEYRREGA